MSLKNRLLENCFKISRFEIYLNFLWKILTNTLKTLANNQFKDNFYGKRKKSNKYFDSFFSFIIKMMSKLFQNGLLTNALRTLVCMIHFLFIKYMNMRMHVRSKLVVFMNYFYQL